MSDNSRMRWMTAAAEEMWQMQKDSVAMKK